MPKRLRLTAGTKFEHTRFTDSRWQPNARVWWAPTERNVFWGAVARALRSPSRADRDFNGTYLLFPADSLFVGAPPVLARLSGSPAFQSERLKAIDVGYRGQFRTNVMVDVSIFHNTYDHLRSSEVRLDSLEFVQNPFYINVPVYADNKTSGTSKGMEISLDWHISARWRMRMAYSYLDIELVPGVSSTEVGTANFAHESPAHQFNVRSYLNLANRLSLNITGRFTDGLPALDIEQYITADVRVAWQANEQWTVALVGRNLANKIQQEFISTATSTMPTAVKRSFYGTITWRLAR
jgi:iron complex outermembrane receptor protein